MRASRALSRNHRPEPQEIDTVLFGYGLGKPRDFGRRQVPGGKLLSRKALIKASTLIL